MPEKYISAMQPGMEIRGIYVLRGKKLLPFRDGSGFFLSLTLADKTGQVEGRVWDGAVEVNGRHRIGDVVQVTGRVTEYNGTRQLHITAVAKGAPGTPERFIPTTGITPEGVKWEWVNLVNTMTNPHLQALLTLMARDQGLIKTLAIAPAAKQNHHARLGGLWQHSISMVKAAEGVAAVYSDIDRDLLVTGALLHDLGKMEEYQVGADISITDAGRLLGHIVLGVALVDGYIKQIAGFPAVLRLKLLHMIVSHHGQYEWQSPKKPKFKEAAILHQLDMLDAQGDMFSEVATGEEGPAESWSGWVRALDRCVFRG